MTSIGQSLPAFWRQRTRREQAFLAVMLLSVATFIYIFGLESPLRLMAAQAERRHAVAQADQARLPAALDELARRQRPPAAALDADALLQSAAAAGITLVPDATSTPGRLTLRFEAVPTQALFAWLAQVQEGQGRSPLKASVRRAAVGVEGEVVFLTAAP